MTAIFLQGHALDALRGLPSDFVQCVVTSPPYANRRAGSPDGLSPDTYVSWFLPISGQFLRVLRPDGTFVLNIKERVVNGERHTYVIELILEMKRQGWLWTEEFVWHKKNCYPGKWPNRFRDSWERLLQFNKAKRFKMFQEAVMVPMGDWATARLSKLSETDKKRDESKVGSGFGKNVSHWLGRDLAYPTNVLQLATECSNQNHGSVFPVAVPEWFIRLYSAEGDLVLDPFSGSGTTALAAERLGRDSINIDVSAKYIQMAKERLAVDEDKRVEQLVQSAKREARLAARAGR